MSTIVQNLISTLIDLSKRNPRTNKFVLAILLFGFYTFLRSKWIQYRRRKNNMPPGPIGIPIFGDLIRFSQLLNTRRHFQYLKDLAKEYPGIASLNLGSGDTIIINDLGLIKQIMSRDEMLDRDPAFIDFVGQNSKTHATQNGIEWLHNKKITQNILNTYGIQNIDAMLHRCITKVILPKIENSNGNPMKCYKLLRYSFFWTFFRLVYGKNETFDDADQKIYDDNLDWHLKRRVVPLAFLSHLTGSWYNYVKKFDSYLFYYFNKYQNVLHKYWLEYNSDNKKKDCMLDLYQNKDIQQSQIFNEIGNVVGGAIDNATNTTMFNLYNLGRLPKIQEEVRKELINVMGDDGFNHKKLSKCVKLKAFVYESMRLLSPNPVGATRYCNKSFFINYNNKKYQIPKGTTVWWNVVATAHDNRYWMGDKYDTSEFNINRWIDNNGKFINRTELLTFGWGKRKCTGRLIVIKEFLHLIGTLLLKYNIKLGTNKYSNHIDDVKSGIGFSEVHDLPFVFTSRN